MKVNTMLNKIQSYLILCLMITVPILPACNPIVYMPVEPAYDKYGKLRTDGHYVKDSYLAKLDEDLKACSK